MKNDKFHILDWSQITRNKKNGEKQSKNKGILFEDLIEKLLSAMFPTEKWARTAESHDGKRDFFFPPEDYLPDQKWAECKNYDTHISLNVIAPTLIMGAIENVESIFFFSYSPLNDNAIEGLLRYSATSNRSIKIFDGRLLEGLICKYSNKNGIADFFPGTDFEEMYTTLIKQKLRVIKILRDMNGNRIPSNHQFELGESFYINTIIQNLTHESVDCSIQISSGNSSLVKLDSKWNDCIIPFAQVEEYSALCHVLKEGTAYFKINIRSTNSDNSFDEIKLVQRIRIIDEPYLFWSGERAVLSYIDSKKHLDCFVPTPLILAAGSGMGKSTLINILTQEENIQKKYSILKIDLNITRNCCIRNLLAHCVGIQWGDKTPKEQIEEDNTALSILIENYAESAESIAETLMSFYCIKRPYLFAIDDIQKVNRAYIDLISALIEISQRDNKPIYFVVGLNEDILSASQFISRVNWDIHYPGIIDSIIRLSKFDKKDIIAFLKHKLGLDGINQYFDGFTKEIRPLEIHSFCASLKKQRIIALIPGQRRYQIVDIFKFAESVNKVLYANHSIAHICNLLDESDIPEFVLKYLYITDEINSTMWQKYTRIIRELISMGILKESEGTVIFHHDDIRKCLSTKIIFSDEDYADLFYNKNIDLHSKAICALNRIDRIRGSVGFLREYFQSNPEIRRINQRYELCQLIFSNLSKIIDVGLCTDALHFVSIQFPLLKSENGHASFYAFMKHIADAGLNIAWDVDEQSVATMAFLIKKFFDRALSTHNQMFCFEYFQKYKIIFEGLKNISDYDRYFWLSHYANRAAIALDRASSPLVQESVEAKGLYAQSESYCRLAGSHSELMIQIAIDDFYRHYSYRHDLTIEMIKEKSAYLRQFSEHQLEDPTSWNYHCMLLSYLDYCQDGSGVVDLHGLRTKVFSLRAMCRSSFYGIKLYMLEIYILIDMGLLVEAEKELANAFEYAIKKEMRSYIYKLTYIKAHLQFLFANRQMDSVILSNFVLAFEQMLNTRRNSLNDLQREIFLSRELMLIIDAYEPECIIDLICLQNEETQNLLRDLHKYVRSEDTKNKALFQMKSYFVYGEVNFPAL